MLVTVLYYYVLINFNKWNKRLAYLFNQKIGNKIMLYIMLYIQLLYNITIPWKMTSQCVKLEKVALWDRLFKYFLDKHTILFFSNIDVQWINDNPKNKKIMICFSDCEEHISHLHILPWSFQNSSSTWKTLKCSKQSPTCYIFYLPISPAQGLCFFPR